LLFLSTSAFAQVGRDIRFVNVDSAEVRSGPSEKDQFYPTNQLKRGQPVEVVAEEPGGWLAIKPPEGSFSYINTRFLRHMYSDMPNHVVTLDGVKVPVFIGSAIVNKRPTIVGARLDPGAQVVSRGQPLADDEGTWMPIESPATERRYIRASAVAKSNTPTEVSRNAPVTNNPERSAFRPTNAAPNMPPANPPLSPDQLWQRAVQAERAGQMTEAIRLYALVGSETAHTNSSLSAMALARARYLQGGYQNYGAGVGVAPPPTMPASPTTPVVVGAPTTPRGNWVQGTPTSSPTPTTVPSAPPTNPIQLANWTTFRGRLRRAGRAVEGQTTYAIDDPYTLRPLVYATAARGINLEAYLNQNIQVSGYSVWRGDLRNNFVTVVRIDSAQP
jgi:SH3-like domain-containing protein